MIVRQLGSSQCMYVLVHAIPLASYFALGLYLDPMTVLCTLLCDKDVYK